MDTLQGQLLIASPTLLDPNFRRTVVLLGHHDDEGAVGVVLNRESEVSVLEAAPSLAPIAGFDARLFLGGPVQREAAVVVADFGELLEQATSTATSATQVSASTPLRRMSPR